MAAELMSLPIPEFLSHLERAGVRRGYIVWDEQGGCFSASHPALAPVAQAMDQDKRDANRHEGVFLAVGPASGALFGAFVHRTCRGQAQGGTRFWRYDDLRSFLADGLRLSKGMTHKNALAGLWWGGGKGVMTTAEGSHRIDPSLRRTMYAEFGEFMTSLGGCYVTAEDVGTSVEDMAAIFSKTRFTTCIPPELGGSGNPSGPTALGVARAIDAALAFRAMGEVRGRTVAIQGLGHVGEPLVEALIARGVGRIVGVDIDEEAVAGIERKYAGQTELDVKVVDRHDASILGVEADVVAPCATGAILNAETIPTIKAPIVCGAANNQLADPVADDRRLLERDITYVPDFLANRMGIVNAADEQYGYIDDDPKFAAHLGDTWDNSVYRLTLEVLEKAKSSATPPGAVALELAEERSFEEHPIWGHRGRLIIRSLMESGWAD